jgi:anti-anti-sigma factor
MAWSCSLYRLGDLDRDRRHRYGDRPPPRRTRPPRLSVREEMTDGTATLVITGELDLTTVPALAWHLEQLLARSPSRVVFDLTRVAFMDVAAARLITESTRSRPGAGRPVVRHPSPSARRVLELTGFDALCEVEE